MSPPLLLAPAPIARITKLCPHCLTENDESAHMCRQCLTPMTFFAATVPVFSVWSEMNTYYKASHSPAKFIVVLGMWIIWGPVCLVYVGWALAILGETFGLTYRRPGSGGALMLLPLMLFLSIPAILLVRTTRTYFGRKGITGTSAPLAPVQGETDELLRAALAAAPEGTEPGDVDDAEEIPNRT